MPDIHDIRPPIQVGTDLTLLKWGILILLALMILTAIVILIRRRLKKRGPIQTVEALPVDLPPLDQALRTLEDLKRRVVSDTGRVYFDLTFVFRRYIGRTFGIHAVEMTTPELLDALGRLDLPSAARKDTVAFLNRADAYKFAGQTPHQGAVAEDLDLLGRLLTDLEFGRKPSQQAAKREP